jgi:dipeptidyl aminopeptidase/acylaminoacyl peptidase
VNYIEKIRAEFKKDFEEQIFQKGEFESFLSTSKKFRADITNFWLKEPNLELAKVEVYDQTTNEKLFDFFVNESRFFHGWLTKNDIEYLICAEDIFGGQTVVDLTNRKIVGYSPKEDGFIWTDFHLSPDGKTLATIGCHWACPYVIRLFDFTDPMTLPLTEIKEIRLLQNNEIILCWLDTETIQLSLSESKTVREDFEDGSHIYKVVTTPVGEKREIKINGT